MRVGVEVKVGIMVMVCVVVLVFIIYWLTGLPAGHYRIKVMFNDAKGIKPGALVQYQGVGVGKVKDVGLMNDKPVVELEIERKYQLRRNYVFKITTGALITECCVEIEYREGPGEVIKPGEMVMGQEWPGIKDVIPKTKELMDSVQQLTISMNSLVSEELRGAVKGGIANLLKVSVNAQALIRSLQGILAENRSDIRGVVANLNKLSLNLADSAVAINQLVSDEALRQDLREALGSLKSASEKIDGVSGRLEELVGDKELILDIKGAVHSIRSVSGKADVISDELAKLVTDKKFISDIKDAVNSIKSASAKLDVVAGEVEELVTDKKFIADIKGAAAMAKEAIGEVREITGRAEEVLKVGARTVGRVSALKAEPYFDLRYYSRGPEHLVSEFNLKMMSKASPSYTYTLGFYGVGDGNKFNLQAGFPYGSRQDYRFGLIRSKMGMGTDIGFPGGYSLSLDLFNPNDLQLNLLGVYELNERWKLQLGLEDMGDKNDLTFGLRYLP